MFFTVDDATYAYDIVGSGPPILLLHGFTGSQHTWQTLVDTLSQTYTVMTVDLPGHGQTKTDTPRSMEACCYDLKQLLEKNGFNQIHILGYSLGGRTALAFAIHYPETVASLILESASPGLDSREERQNRQKHDDQLAHKLKTGGLKAFIDFWENIPLFASQKKLPTQVRQVIRQERLSQSVQGLALSLCSMGTGMQPSGWGKLRDLNLPILLIVGNLDLKFVAINEQMLQHMKTARIKRLENCGHAIHVEQPEKFGKIVKRFLKLHN